MKPTDLRERATVSLFGLMDAMAAYQQLTDAPKEDDQ